MNINNQQTIEIKNQGQKVIYLLREAYKQGKFAVSNDVAPEIQFILNQPVEIDPRVFKPEEEDITFLNLIMEKVDLAEIKLFTPASLLNQSVYQNLNSAQQAKADFDILTLLNKIRAIRDLWEAGDRNSYQLFNLVKSLRLSKERLEESTGDVFII